ncbi:MAG TPA: alpha/beta hydrolase [Planctomycetota bacterium]|nr:alpha/beta hydrolase [Planctomycetota bacterium]
MAKATANGISLHIQHLHSGSPAADRGSSTVPDPSPTDAPPLVVFLHGLVMDNLSSWYFTIANAIAAEHEVLLYDLRGHGKSERPSTGYGVADMVADLACLLEATGHGQRRVELIGNSFGGLLAVAFALAHPERVSGLALVDGSVHDEAWGSEMTDTLGLEGEEARIKIADSFRGWTGRHSEKKRNRLAKTAAALVYDTSMVRDLATSPPPRDAELRRITCPVLALYGADSDVQARGTRQAKLFPHCDLRIHAGCTHSILWERTGELRGELIDWLGAEERP